MNNIDNVKSFASLPAAIAAGIAVAAAIVSIGGAITTVPRSSPTPKMSETICLPAGSSVTLPSGAAIDFVETVADCTAGAEADPRRLEKPSIVLASSDATIAGATSFAIEITGQGTSFRKAAAGLWRPF